MGEFSIERFEASGKENGTRFWSAHQFMTDLGYDSWPIFQKVVTKAMGSCAKLGIDPTEAFSPFNFIEEGKEVKSYRLSRFACFLISMHADSKKEEVAKAKVLLAAIADTLIQERIQEHDLGRIETREDLKLAERSLSGVAQDAGLESTQFGIFKDAGFRGMYNMGLRELRIRKGIDGSKTLYDFMGLEEMAANLFRVTQTAARIKNQGIQGLPSLSYTATRVGREVRGLMTKNGGTPPEALPIAEDITRVQRRLRSTNKAMNKFDGGKKKTKALPQST